MKLTSALIIGIVTLVAAFSGCKKGGIDAEVNTAIAQGRFQFIALLDSEGRFTYPEVPRIPDWYFQTTGISVRQTKPDTKEADLAHMKEYNTALMKELKAQGKFHLIEENVARVRANVDKQRQ